MKSKIDRYLSSGRVSQAFALIIESRMKYRQFDSSGELLVSLTATLFPGSVQKGDSRLATCRNLALGLLKNKNYQFVIDLANGYPEFFLRDPFLVNIVGGAHLQIGEKENALGVWLSWVAEYETFSPELVHNLLLVMSELKREKDIGLLPENFTNEIFNSNLDLLVLWSMVSFKYRPKQTSENDVLFEIILQKVRLSSNKKLMHVMGDILQIFCWSGRADALRFISSEIHAFAQTSVDINSVLWFEEIDEVAVAHRYCRKIARTSGDRRALRNLGFLDLKIGNFAQGFESIKRSRKFGSSALELSEVDRLDIWCDQGLGDVIFFSRFIPYFFEKHSWLKIRIVGDRRLKFLFRDFDFISDDPDGTACIRLSDLPTYCDGNCIEVAPPCFSTELGRLVKPSEERQGLGVSWRSSSTEIGFRKSTEPSNLLNEVNKSATTSLQYGLDEDERRLLESNGVTEPEFDINQDIEKLFRLVGSLSEVVSVSNLNAHIGGFLSIPTTVLVGTGRSKFWYWAHVDENGYSVFYPSVKVVTALP